MAKFKVGDKVIAFGDLKKTDARWSLNGSMLRLKKNRTVMRVRYVDGRGVTCGKWEWHPADLRYADPKLALAAEANHSLAVKRRTIELAVREAEAHDERRTLMLQRLAEAVNPKRVRLTEMTI